MNNLVNRVLQLDTIEKQMQFGKRIRRNKLSRWIWKYVKLSNHAYLVANLYDEYIMVIGNTFICTNCAIVFSDTIIVEDGYEVVSDSQTQAFMHIEKEHAKVVDINAPD